MVADRLLVDPKYVVNPRAGFTEHIASYEWYVEM